MTSDVLPTGSTMSRPGVGLERPAAEGATPIDGPYLRSVARRPGADAQCLVQLPCLLWAAFGINRRFNARRTASPTPRAREIDLYVVTAQGSYRYDPCQHRLNLVNGADLRSGTNRRDADSHDPVNLLYVSDWARPPEVRGKEHARLLIVEADGIAANVGHFCVDAGLMASVRRPTDRKRLASALALQPTQRIVFAQSVGPSAPA